MKRIILALVAIITVSAFALAKTESEKVTFKVNMHCAACQQKIEKNIAFEKGVKDMKVNLEDKTVCVTYDASKTNAEKLKAGFAKLGYEANVDAPKACKNTTGDKKCCTKEGAEKQCCKAGAEAKACAKEGTEKQCCKAGAEAKACANENGEKKCDAVKTQCPADKKI